MSRGEQRAVSTAANTRAHVNVEEALERAAHAKRERDRFPDAREVLNTLLQLAATEEVFEDSVRFEMIEPPRTRKRRIGTMIRAEHIQSQTVATGQTREEAAQALADLLWEQR